MKWFKTKEEKIRSWKAEFEAINMVITRTQQISLAERLKMTELLKKLGENGAKFQVVKTDLLIK